MIDKSEAINRTKYIAIFAVVLLILFLTIGYPMVALGLGVGTGVCILNYWLVIKVALNTKGQPESIVQNQLMKRYLLRFLMLGVTIIVTALIDTQLFLGAALGLTLEMLSYLWEAGKQIRGKL